MYVHAGQALADPYSSRKAGGWVGSAGPPIYLACAPKTAHPNDTAQVLVVLEGSLSASVRSADL